MNISRRAISAVMTRNVCHVSIQQSAKDALALMQRHTVSSVLVTEDEMILGIITERDIVRALQCNDKLKTLSCVDLMQAPVVTTPATTSCLDAYHLMASRSIRHLAVTDKAGHVLGVASEGDVMRNFGIEYYMNFKDVASVMSTDFCKVPLSATLADALDLVIEKHQSCAVVVDGKGRPAGMLTERDAVRLWNEEVKPGKLAVREAMHAPVMTVKPRRRLHAAVKSMEEARIRRLVVVDNDGVACGLLTHHEIARGLEGDYATYLKEIVELQARNLQQAAQAIDEKLLLANILRSVTGTALLASDLDYRISYATPSVAQVLGLSLDEVGGTDIRETLRRAGWPQGEESLSEVALVRSARHYLVPTRCGTIDFQASVLLDGRQQMQGYLVLAQKA
jgi:CBS domain-containing protein